MIYLTLNNKKYNNISIDLNIKYFLLNLIKLLNNYFIYNIKFNDNIIIKLNKIFYILLNNNNYNDINIYISYIVNNKILINYKIYNIFSINKNIIYFNNIKKIFINRLSNNYGLFFSKTKNNIIYCNYFKNKNVLINILLINNIFYIKFNNNLKLNLITFLNLKGFTNNFIYYNFKKTFNNCILKNIINSNKYLNVNYNLSYINSINFKEILIIFNIIRILLKIQYNKLNLTDIDHFNNKYIETLKNFLNDSLIISLDRLSYNMYNNNYVKLLKNLNKTFKENISVNPLCQILNLYETNFNLSFKCNKISLIGPGSLFSKNNFNMKLKSIHLSQLGNICLLDTYDNFKCGLIVNLTNNSFIDINGNINSELKIVNLNSIRNNKIYIESNKLEKLKINLNSTNFKKYKTFNINKHIVSYKGEFYIKTFTTNRNNIIFNDFSNKFSFIINLIPFLNFNDPIRVLMGSKMINQSLKLIFNEFPLVKTNLYNKFEDKNILSLKDCIIIKICNFYIKTKSFDNKIITYYLNNFYKCKVWEGEKILKGDLIAYNRSFNNCYGKNLLLSYNYFYGYEFEDAFIVNNSLVYNYTFSSLKFNNYLIKFIKNKNKLEYSTFNIPKLNNLYKINLNKKFGLPIKNKYFNSIYVFLGKILIKNNYKTNNFNYLFGNILNNIVNKSFNIKNSNNFNKLVKIITSKSLNTNYFISIYFTVLSLNNLNIGDKLSGRYGNKGVISLLLNKIDLPYNIKGYIPDIIINPLSVPSRMNLGQIYEGLFGFISLFFNVTFIINLNILINYKFIKNIIYNYYYNIKKFNLNYKNKFKLKNPYNGYYFLNNNYILNSYFLKLMHLSSEKINKRSIDNENKYYSITQQPVKGIKHKGGQRFGEMELWALNAYKSIYNISELFNNKSDNIVFRNDYLNNKVNTNFYFSESYISLIKELSTILIMYKPVNVIYKNE